MLRLLAQLSPARLFSTTPTVATLRRAWQLCVKAFASREAVAEVREYTLDAEGGAVTLRAYIPHALADRSARPALLWIHGGGFVFGDLYTAGATCRKLANAAECVVIAVKYRLAPEASLHQSLDDCLRAFRWLAANPEEFGLDPARIAVGGDSAGGTLAALLAQRCAAFEGSRPVAQVLAYPATNLASSYLDTHTAPMADRMLAELFRWLQKEIPRRDLDDPSLSPAAAKTMDGLPPAVVLTTGFDPLRDEGLAYARQLANAGVPVRLLHFPGQFHGFLSFDNVLKGARLAFDQIGATLAGFLESGRLDSGAETADAAYSSSWSWLWLRPSQRLRELAVTCALIGEGFRSLRAPVTR